MNKCSIILFAAIIIVVIILLTIYVNINAKKLIKMKKEKCIVRAAAKMKLTV